MICPILLPWLQIISYYPSIFFSTNISKLSYKSTKKRKTLQDLNAIEITICTLCICIHSVSKSCLDMNRIVVLLCCLSDCGCQSRAGEHQLIEAEGAAVAWWDNETEGRTDLLEGLEPLRGHGRTRKSLLTSVKASKQIYFDLFSTVRFNRLWCCCCLTAHTLSHSLTSFAKNVMIILFVLFLGL